MGRHRIYDTNADRQKAYRERLAARRPPLDPRTAELNARVLKTFNKVMDRRDGSS